MAASNIMNNVHSFSRNGFGLPLLVILVLAMMILPLPAFILDFLFTFNMALGMMVLLATVYARKSLDFAVFPTVLLITTLLRLSLNVASTRIVLLKGHEGTDAAGKVIESFGDVVIGGNYTVGIVVFAILVIINFVVITKGAGRVSEVSARFTLDAMPGKQMAIDADLNAGLITQDEAKSRRAEVSEEADFYGAMDGASKFVRGDAIAGILILVINLIGGLAIGVFQHDMNFSEAIHNFALLTIGDGIVAQVPSLLMSTAAAIMVTRVSGETDMSGQFFKQLLNNPGSLYITAAMIGSMGLIPGMPHVSFLGFAGLISGLAYYLQQRESKGEAMAVEAAETEDTTEKDKLATELDWDDVKPVDTISLDVGYRLINLVDQKQSGELMNRIKSIRKKISQELGFLVPRVHIRDNLDLTPNHYRIALMGVSMGEAEVHVDRELAINPGQVYGELKGIETKDPAYGLAATWIDSGQKEQAKTFGYTVVDPSTVVATHLSQLITDNAAQLLGHAEVQELVERLKITDPQLVENLIPEKLSYAIVLKVMQSLLQERIPVRDVRTIIQTLAEWADRTQDPDILYTKVRVALAGLITQTINGPDEEIPVITLEPELEQILQQTMQASGQEHVGFEPGLAERMQKSLSETSQAQELAGRPSILLVQPNLRMTLSRFVRFSVPSMSVLSYQELPENKRIRIVGTVGGAVAEQS